MTGFKTLWQRLTALDLTFNFFVFLQHHGCYKLWTALWDLRFLFVTPLKMGELVADLIGLLRGETPPDHGVVLVDCVDGLCFPAESRVGVQAHSLGEHVESVVGVHIVIRVKVYFDKINQFLSDVHWGHDNSF